LLFILSKFLLNPFMYWVAKPRSRELFLCWNLAFAIGLSLLTELLGFSFGFGAFLAGLLLSQTPYRFQVLSEMSPFRYAFSSIFFISVGTLVQIPFVWTHLPILLLLTFFIWIFKAFFTALSLRIAGLTLAVAIQVGLSLGQVGEFSFLILSMGQTHGVLKDEFYQMTLSLVSLTLILTPLMVKLSPMLVKRIRKYQKVSHELKSEHYQNHVIICGFGPLGQALGRMLQTHQIPFVVLELNPQTVQSHQGKIPIFFGDGSSEEILFESGVEQARALVVAAPDFINSVSIIEQARRMNANLTIITRARYRSEVSDLYQAGADIVISEELEGAIEMGKYLLLDLKVSEKEVYQFVKEIRDFGSADFF
ncbi:MAG: cation:proton antiporter, partial [Deltaproteobacteria bacterium]|nr:cation:proton antiporter [Deltaproteobacteria bacterium]